MTVAELVMPDPLTLVRAYLITVADVTALVSNRITDRTGDTLPTRPFVRMDLVGGRPANDIRLDRSRIQVHVFGAHETEPATLAAAQTVRAALVAARGWVHTDGVITGVSIEVGPSVFPDTTHTPHLVDATFVASVFTRPA